VGGYDFWTDIDSWAKGKERLGRLKVQVTNMCNRKQSSKEPKLSAGAGTRRRLTLRLQVRHRNFILTVNFDYPETIILKRLAK
jgi:hypothetical protein